MKKLLLGLLIALSVCPLWAQNSKKREFRGAWMHTVSNDWYAKLSPEQWRDTISKQLDAYQAIGINAILFQVRPEGDAFYKSDIEPWSRYLTGEQGLAPDPEFDPMEFMIEQCHQRCMEFHAWINPYRANTNKQNPLCEDHLYFKKRYLFFPYGNQLFFDPGRPENRKHICKVIKDIVSRYDIDAIHFDDYFYPYPLKGVKIPDNASFSQYGIPFGYSSITRYDWRRDNVNRLIQELSDTIKATKPWVAFGISPFGIYRNKRQSPIGSETNGLSNYDDLYADILLWMQKGWIDYCVPQLYWEIGHTNADYATLIKWWASVSDSLPVHLYIGQDVNRTYKQYAQKMDMGYQLPQVKGNCFWSGAMLLKNPGHIQDSLKAHYFGKPALLPIYQHIDTLAPDAPYRLKLALDSAVPQLYWESGIERSEMNRIRYYAVYAFDLDEPISTTTSEHLIGITVQKQLALPTNVPVLQKRFVVTAIDRLHNESLPSNYIRFDEYQGVYVGLPNETK